MPNPYGWRTIQMQRLWWDIFAKQNSPRTHENSHKKSKIPLVPSISATSVKLWKSYTSSKIYASKIDIGPRQVIFTLWNSHVIFCLQEPGRYICFSFLDIDFVIDVNNPGGSHIMLVYGYVPRFWGAFFNNGSLCRWVGNSPDSHGTHDKFLDL